jgi:hypothetical protein
MAVYSRAGAMQMNEPTSLDEERLRAIFRALADGQVEYAVFGAVALALSPRTLWRMKKDTARPTDRFDAQALADRFGFKED